MGREQIEDGKRSLTLFELDDEGNKAAINISNGRFGEEHIGIGVEFGPCDAVRLGRWLLNWGER